MNVRENLVLKTDVDVLRNLLQQKLNLLGKSDNKASYLPGFDSTNSKCPKTGLVWFSDTPKSFRFGHSEKWFGCQTVRISDSV